MSNFIHWLSPVVSNCWMCMQLSNLTNKRSYIFLDPLSFFNFSCLSPLLFLFFCLSLSLSLHEKFSFVRLVNIFSREELNKNSWNLIEQSRVQCKLLGNDFPYPKLNRKTLSGLHTGGYTSYKCGGPRPSGAPGLKGAQERASKRKKKKKEG